MPQEEKERNLAELAEESGVPARTIRFYISRGLLPGPLSAGRGAVYSDEHMERLEAIRKLQAKGLTLAEVGRALGGDKAREALPAPSAWWQYSVAEDVTVSVRGDASPWRLRQIRAALAQLAAQLEQETDHDHGT